MIIANPIYDVVFKYLMEDNKIAKQIISLIIREEVLELTFSPQEHTARGEGSITVYRIDFMAKIKTPQGSKVVMIEMQKAKLAADIIRFRRYLGGCYRDKGNGTYLDENKVRRPLEIYCIFFLGYALGDSPSPVLKVDYQVHDDTTGEELSLQHEFIKGLHHRSWIIQIPHLKQHRRNALEQLLAVFDQENISSDEHILNIREEDFPTKYRHIIRRLQQAASSPQVQDEMDMEDDYIEELRARERANLQKIEEKDKALEETTKVLKEKDKVIMDKDKALEEQAKALEEQAKEIEALKRRLSSDATLDN
ncbi:MAG: hypothetical protein LBQ73_08860 [Tannerellaceae bacterium]|jgi:hypothetical protein|nr:hypothetical protein [Tannerellaceae bacterium]